jgi:hypothetical protein
MPQDTAQTSTEENAQCGHHGPTVDKLATIGTKADIDGSVWSSPRCEFGTSRVLVVQTGLCLNFLPLDTFQSGWRNVHRTPHDTVTGEQHVYSNHPDTDQVIKLSYFMT